jgi:uncharacterized protein with HEPN domain
MPHPDDTTRLRHTMESAHKAIRFTAGRSRTDFINDEVLLLAVIRLLEIIGEAASGISDDFKSQHPEIPWRKMSDMRNRLIHGYFDVEPRLVWETLLADLPPLVEKLQAALKNEPG